MKTHELAKALSTLSRVLLGAPNVELSQLNNLLQPAHPKFSRQELVVNLTTLANLSQVDRAQWVEFIHEHNLPILFTARDSSRNILGKLLSYLQQNPTAIENLRNGAQREGAQASPELMRALSSLLKG